MAAHDTANLLNRASFRYTAESLKWRPPMCRLLFLSLVLSLALSSSVLAESETIDRSGSWDVNGPLGPTDTAEFTTDEGTWMSLDVHPDGNSIIFDLLGDLYVMPVAGGKATRLTHGAAMDLQPRFSPDGSQVLFTSDRGGNANSWAASFDGEKLSDIKVVSEQTGNMINGADWTADGKWILARKRVTDTSSIGISELWLLNKDGGSGIQLVADKGEVDSFSSTADGKYIYFNASGPFSYNRDPYSRIWSLMRYDRDTGEKRQLTGGNGSAAAHALSPDERSIAFVRRVGTKSTLWIHTLADGSERQIWDGLDRDQIEGFGTNYVYPGYDWTPDGSSLIVWAGGNINRVAADGSGASIIPFAADVSLPYRQPLRSARDPAPETVQAKLIRWPVVSPDGSTLVFTAFGHLYYQSLPDGTPERVTSATDFEFAPTFSPDGSRLAFTTWNDDNGGTLKTIAMRRGIPGSANTVYTSRWQLVNPSFSHDGSRLLVVAGSGANLRGEELGSELRHDIIVLNSNGRGTPQIVTTAANRGSQIRVTRPTFSKDGSRIWYFDSEAVPGERGSRQPDKTILHSIKLDGTDKKSHMGFRLAQEVMVSPDETRVAFTELHNAYITALPKSGVSVDFDPTSAALPFKQLSQDGGEWVTWSAAGKHISWGFGQTVSRAIVADLELTPKAEPADSGDHGINVIAVGVTDEGKYTYGDATLELDELKLALQKDWQASVQVRVDVTLRDKSPWSAWHSLNKWLGEAKVGIKQVAAENNEKEDEESDEAVEPETYTIDLQLPRSKPDGTFALTGARIITMNDDEVIENGTVVVTNNRIAAVGSATDISIPNGARTFDVSGKTVMPGLIDVHAHLGYSSLDVNPQKDYQYYANLAYGVTTTHDPSASTHTVFSQSEMVSAGVMTGPRIFSTGFILYGAAAPDKAVINSYADALSHVRRLKALGAFSVKSYEQPRRDQRQWIIRAAAAEDMLVVPEGGGDFPKNLGMVLDGHSGIEHAMSPGHIYKDVSTLFATTRAGYTATLLVAYAGQSGENWFYQHYNVWENEKLQSFFPPRAIDARARRRSMSAEDDFNHKNVAGHLKAIDDAGGLVTLGAHGQLQGLGAHWELWAMTQGGMQNHNALRAATINGAEYLGMKEHLGSISQGKLADLIVLDKNPLEKIENSDSVNLTVINGVVYDANSMDQVWPQEVPRGRFFFQQ
jgi:imidazolonepropionase-like amidohydrolase/Tol biopolymer transport system component